MADFTTFVSNNPRQFVNFFFLTAKNFASCSIDWIIREVLENIKKKYE